MEAGRPVKWARCTRTNTVVLWTVASASRRSGRERPREAKQRARKGKGTSHTRRYTQGDTQWSDGRRECCLRHTDGARRCTTINNYKRQGNTQTHTPVTENMWKTPTKHESVQIKQLACARCQQPYLERGSDRSHVQYPDIIILRSSVCHLHMARRRQQGFPRGLQDGVSRHVPDGG